MACYTIYSLSTTYLFVLYVVLAGLALSHANVADFSLLTRKNFYSLVDYWTSQVNAEGEPIGSTFTATPVSARSSDQELRMGRRAELRSTPRQSLLLFCLR